MVQKISINQKREIGKRSPMIYGQFIEHFHRQIYNGIYDPGNPLSDEDGFRTDIIEAIKKIKTPVLRWPGGCFVSSYHWKNAVGKKRIPFFDKAWRVEEPNSFGTDEYIKLCRKLECEPYICTNAGTGTAEEMSDWVEYCNLEKEGQYAGWRIENGHSEPYHVKYWSIGNENYGFWEIGAKSAEEWGRLVAEAAKMMKHVDPTIELSAAALADINWNINLLKHCGSFLDWISIHQYWDMMPEQNNPATYEQCMAFTDEIDRSVQEVRGILTAMKLEHKIKIAFDEWNLRSWHHPNVHTIEQGISKEEYLYPRDKNDDNSTYTMADAVFTACFLNAMNRNCDIVGMANFAPILNTRGCIYSNDSGIVLRSTYYVFELYVNYMGDVVIDTWEEEQIPQMIVTHKNGMPVKVKTLDILATKWSDKPGLAVAIINKNPTEEQYIELDIGEQEGQAILYTLNGPSENSYNDVNNRQVEITKRDLGQITNKLSFKLPPHSVNVLQV